MRLQTWKPQKFKEKIIGNHKETQKTLVTSGLFDFTRIVEKMHNEVVVLSLKLRPKITAGIGGLERASHLNA